MTERRTFLEELEDHKKESLLAIRILRSLWSSQVEELIKVLGSKQTVDLLSPFIIRMSTSGTLKMKAFLDVQEGGINGLAKTFSVMVPCNVMNDPDIIVYEDGICFIGHVGCPFKNSLREICTIHDQGSVRGSLEAFGLEHDFEWIMDFDTYPDASCNVSHFLVRKGALRPTGPEIARYMIKDLRAKYGQDWMDDLSIQFKAEYFAQTSNMALEELGQQHAEELLVGAAERTAVEVADDWKKDNLMSLFEISDIQSLLATLGRSMKQQSEVIERSKDTFVRRVLSCPFSETNSLVCAQIESFTSKLFSELCPGHSYERKGSMTEGNGHCEFLLNPMRSWASEDMDDPLKILKLRFAKGEISENEYLRMKELLMD